MYFKEWALFQQVHATNQCNIHPDQCQHQCNQQTMQSQIDYSMEPDGSLCLDQKYLHKAIERNQQHTRTIDDILPDLVNSKIIILKDTTLGYWQVILAVYLQEQTCQTQEYWILGVIIETETKDPTLSEIYQEVYM